MESSERVSIQSHVHHRVRWPKLLLLRSRNELQLVVGRHLMLYHLRRVTRPDLELWHSLVRHRKVVVHVIEEAWLDLRLAGKWLVHKINTPLPNREEGHNPLFVDFVVFGDLFEFDDVFGFDDAAQQCFVEL